MCGNPPFEIVLLLQFHTLVNRNDEKFLAVKKNFKNFSQHFYSLQFFLLLDIAGDLS
jgi:hypothetical protein